METVKQTTPEASPVADTVTRVRLLADYIAHDDVTVVQLGELCEVLGYHGDDWVYVCRSAEYGHQELYVPASYVQRVEASSSTSSTYHSNATSSSLTRARTFNSSAPRVTLGNTGISRSVSLRDNSSPEASANNAGWYTDDLPDPPPQATNVIAFGDVTKSSAPVAGTRLSTGVVRDPRDVSDSQRSKQRQEQDQEQNETSSMYANWAEIQQLANNQNHRSESSAKLAPKNLPDVVIGKPAAPERSPTTLLSKTSAPLPGDDATRTRHHHHRSASSGNQVQSPVQPEANTTVEVLNSTLLNKLGDLNCLHANENGKTVV